MILSIKKMSSWTIDNDQYRWGFHMSIAGGKKWVDIITSFLQHPIRAYQVYLGNSRAKRIPKFDSSDVVSTGKLLQRMEKYLVIHGALIYNPCGSVDYKEDPDFQYKLDSTRKCLTAELDMGVGFGTGVVLHIGSCKNKEKGIQTIVKTLEYCCSVITEEARRLSSEMDISLEEFISRRKIILENAAGEGNKIGSTLEEIATIISKVDEKWRHQIKVCIDTAHLCGWGEYDFGIPEDIDSFYSKFDTLIGEDKLELFHLNDSLVPMGSKKDRHQSLGEGYLFKVNREDGRDGSEGLRHFFLKASEKKIPFISETPEDFKCFWYVHEHILPQFTTLYYD